jgi:hypothetical protein
VEARDRAERELLAPLDPRAERELRSALQAIVTRPDLDS